MTTHIPRKITGYITQENGKPGIYAVMKGVKRFKNPAIIPDRKSLKETISQTTSLINIVF